MNLIFGLGGYTEILGPAIIFILMIISMVFTFGSDKIKTYTTSLIVLVLLILMTTFCGHLLIQDIEFCMVSGCL